MDIYLINYIKKLEHIILNAVEFALLESNGFESAIFFKM